MNVGTLNGHCKIPASTRLLARGQHRQTDNTKRKRHLYTLQLATTTKSYHHNWERGSQIRRYGKGSCQGAGAEEHQGAQGIHNKAVS